MPDDICDWCDICGGGIGDGERYVAVDRITERRHGTVASPTDARPLLRAHRRCAPSERDLHAALDRACRG